MDIYSFVNSKDIREHLRKMDYRFNSLETAWLIYQCRHISYEEQKAAWIELINTMPDCEVPKRSNCRGFGASYTGSGKDGKRQRISGHEGISVCIL